MRLISSYFVVWIDFGNHNTSILFIDFLLKHEFHLYAWFPLVTNVFFKSMYVVVLLRLILGLQYLRLKFIVQYEDQFSKWHRFQEKHNEADAVRTAKARAKATGKRFRVVDADGRLIDLIYP